MARLPILLVVLSGWLCLAGAVSAQSEPPADQPSDQVPTDQPSRPIDRLADLGGGQPDASGMRPHGGQEIARYRPDVVVDVVAGAGGRLQEGVRGLQTALMAPPDGTCVSPAKSETVACPIEPSRSTEPNSGRYCPDMRPRWAGCVFSVRTVRLYARATWAMLLRLISGLLPVRPGAGASEHGREPVPDPFA